MEESEEEFANLLPAGETGTRESEPPFIKEEYDHEEDKVSENDDTAFSSVSLDITPKKERFKSTDSRRSVLNARRTQGKVKNSHEQKLDLSEIRPLRCLFCFREKCETGVIMRNELEDSSRVIFVLTKMLKIDSKELIEFLKMTGGESPWKWINVCEVCAVMVEEALKVYDQIKRLEQRLLEYADKAEEKIKRSANMGIYGGRGRCQSLISRTRMKQCLGCGKKQCCCHKSLAVTNRIRTSIVSGRDFSSKIDDKTVSRIPAPSVCHRKKASPRKKKTRKLQDDDDFMEEDLSLSGFSGPALSEPEDDPLFQEHYTKSDDFAAEMSDPDYEPDQGERETTVSTSKANNTGMNFKRIDLYGGFYECPFCPNLPLQEPMNIQRFVNHIVFHKDNPCKCTICKIYVPDDPLTRTEHMNKFHAEVEEHDRLWIKPDMNLIKIYDCWKCETRYSTWEERDLHAMAEHNIVMERSVECPNCNEYFSTLPEVKVHQALSHPDIARLSCIACFETFSKENLPDVLDDYALSKHVAVAHPAVRISSIRLCPLCGFPFKTYNGRGCYGLKFHTKSFHADLANTLYECSLCDQNFWNISEHQHHLNTVHLVSVDRRLLNASEGVTLGEIKKTWPMFVLQCGLCFVGTVNKSVKAFQFDTETKLEEHLLKRHKLKVQYTPPFHLQKLIKRPKHRKTTKPKDIPIKTTVKKSKISNPKPRPKKKPHTKFTVCVTAETEPKPNPEEEADLKYEKCIYSCSSCPHLKAMGFNEFIVHILFHWRQPHKCTECDWYLSNVETLINQHWKDYHSSLEAKVDVKYKEVNFVFPNIWQCSSCDIKLSTSTDRDQHEFNEHGIYVERKEACNVCNETFRTTAEIRLHKAQHHPEAAELCCPYCDESCSAISLEGAVFRNPRVVFDHLVEKHPRGNSRGRPSIIEACIFCGEVFSKPYDLINHCKRKHEVRDDKQSACTLCHRQMSCKNLQRHLYTVHVPKLTCDVCGIIVRAAQMRVHRYKAHRIAEPGAKIWKCEEEGCDYETVKLAYYNRHQKSHEENNHKKAFCQYCGAGFKDRSYLQRHEKIHLNAETKPYSCEICGARFPVRGYLYVHKRVNHYKNWKYQSKKRKKS